MATVISDARVVREEVDRRRYHVLDGARGIAALAVVTAHWDKVLSPIVFPGAQRAVDLFFLMSGFVLALKYDRRLGNTLTFRTFMLKRAARLWPVAALGTVLATAGVVMALLAHAPLSWTWRSLLAFAVCNLIFLPGPPSAALGGTLFPLNVPAWSLFWEVAVNAFYAAIRPILPMGALLFICTSSAACLAMSIAWYGSAGGGWSWDTFPQGMARVMFGFFGGVLLYRLHSKGNLPVRLPTWLSFAVLIGVLSIGDLAGSRALADGVLIFVVIPLLVAALVNDDTTWGGRAMGVLGAISYPIYALHYPTERLVVGIFEKLSHQQVSMFAPYLGLAMLAALAAGCLLVERYFELPTRERLERWLGFRSSIGTF